METGSIAFSESEDVEKTKKVESGAVLLDFIKSFCRENKIPFLNIAEHNEVHAIQLSKLINNQKEDFISLIESFNSKLPDTIFYRDFRVGAWSFESTRTFVTLDRLLSAGRNISSEQIIKFANEKIDFDRKIFDLLKHEIAGYKVYLSYSGQVFLLNVGMAGGFDFDSADAAFDDDFDDELEQDSLDADAFRASFEESYQICEKYARELCFEKRLMIAKNYEQRYSVAKDFFGERISEITVSIDAVVKRAMNIFDLEVFPNLVKELKQQGKTPKQIADELGVSLAKAKKVFAIV